MCRAELKVVAEHSALFTEQFAAWLPDNLHVYDAFADEAHRVIAMGFGHYSARTILHYLRHHSAVTERDAAGWKLNDHYSPYLARLFDLLNPHLAGLFEYRQTPATEKDQ